MHMQLVCALGPPQVALHVWHAQLVCALFREHRTPGTCSLCVCAPFLLYLTCCCPGVAQVLEHDHLNRKGKRGRRCSWQLAEELVREVDLDNDGTVSYEEFRNMWATQETVAA